MDKLHSMIKALEDETKKAYIAMELLTADDWKRHREILNKIRYNEAKLEELKKYLKSLSSIRYHII